MRKATLILAATMIVVSIAGCGKTASNADDYADKLVSGEIQSQVKTEHEENTEAPSEAASETQDNEGVEITLDVTEESMGEMVDKVISDYKSFELMPIDAPDFFVGKKMQIVATISDHQMSNISPLNFTTEFTHNKLSVDYTKDGNEQKSEYVIYKISDKVLTSPGGGQYTYAAYGEGEITSENTTGVVAVITKIKMNDDIDMGDGKADDYVMLEEVGKKGAYQVMRVTE